MQIMTITRPINKPKGRNHYIFWRQGRKIWWILMCFHNKSPQKGYYTENYSQHDAKNEILRAAKIWNEARITALFILIKSSTWNFIYNKTSQRNKVDVDKKGKVKLSVWLSFIL